VNAGARFLRIFSFVLVAAFLPAAGAAATPSRGPAPHHDATDATASPLDILSVTLGQRGTEILMRITTAGDWEPSQLAPGAGQALCVRLYYGRLPTPRSRICAVDRGAGSAGLSYARLDPFGNIVDSRALSATVSRPDKRSLQAVFEPSAANLGLGRYSWQAESTWACEQPAACADLAPDGGNVIARIRPLAEPRCFGAASRNPRHRCTNRALRLAVMPPPSEAVLSPNARCAIISMSVPYTCQFGVRASIAERTVALVGDSHASHWRAALEVVAQARRWRGFSLTRSGCPLSTAPPDLPRARRASCKRWRSAVRRWFRRHPQVRTVFVSQLASADIRVPRGRDREEYEIQSFLRAWRRLPRSVRQIVVLRDTPVSTDHASVCVQQAVIDHRPAGSACAVSRGTAVRRDRAALATRRRGARRVHLVDLTPFMCSPRLCFPVVGGVLVFKDKTHMTPLFAATLGPFLLRRVDRLLG
jgi:hypothetical protein